MKTFLDRLKFALEQSGKTKTDLWDQCGLTSGAVSQWFSKPSTQLRGANLICVARVLGVNPEWLATGEGEWRSSEGPRIKPSHSGVSKSRLTASEQRSILRLAELMEPKSRKKWIAIGASLPSISPTTNAVDEAQSKQLKSEVIPKPEKSRGKDSAWRELKVDPLFKPGGNSRVDGKKILNKKEGNK